MYYRPLFVAGGNSSNHRLTSRLLSPHSWSISQVFAHQSQTGASADPPMDEWAHTSHPRSHIHEVGRFLDPKTHKRLKFYALLWVITSYNPQQQ